MIKIDVISNTRALLGEGPIYKEETNSILWVDIIGKSWFETHLDDCKTDVHPVPELIGALSYRNSGGLILAVERGFAEVFPDGHYELISNCLPGPERMNDAKCDAVGRLWAGSTELEFKAGQGKLHRLNPDLSHETILTGLTLPNGLGWNPANTVFYLVDSMERVLWAFDYDLATGDISNKRVFFDFQSIDGLADGLCVSDDGTIFVAIWDGACILLISEEGELLDKIDLPVLRPTSCCFGGDGCRDLIVTTASVEMNLTKQPESGKLLRLSGIGKRGLKSFLFET